MSNPLILFDIAKHFVRFRCLFVGCSCWFLTILISKVEEQMQNRELNFLGIDNLDGSEHYIDHELEVERQGGSPALA